MRFCEWLRYQIDEPGESMTHVGKMLNITRKTVWLHAHGKAFPYVSTFEKYCGYFGIPKDRIRPLYYEFKEAELDYEVL